MGPNRVLLDAAVNEVLLQCEYADVAYANIQNKISNVVFSSIHSFLSHCGVISRFLWDNQAIKSLYGECLADILGLASSMQIKNRRFRDGFDHFDERLPIWLESLGDKNVFDSTIGSRSSMGGDNIHYLRHFDRSDNTYVFMDENLNLAQLHGELHKIQEVIESSLIKLEEAKKKLASPTR